MQIKTFKEFVDEHRKMAPRISYAVGTPGFFDLMRLWNTLAMLNPKEIGEVVVWREGENDLALQTPNPFDPEEIKAAAEREEKAEKLRKKVEKDRQAKLAKEAAEQIAAAPASTAIPVPDAQGAGAEVVVDLPVEDVSQQNLDELLLNASQNQQKKAAAVY